MELNIPNEMRFLITCSIDPDGFRRLQCPRCTMTFKIMVNPGEYSDPLALRLSRLFEEDDEVDDGIAELGLCCPYCAHSARCQDFIDDEMERTIRAVARTQVIEPAVEMMMAGLTKSFKKLNSSFMKVTVTETHAPRPMLMFGGPEVADMRHATLLCCNREIKLNEQWTERFFCPHCRTELIMT